jgi:hypothetical protein
VSTIAWIIQGPGAVLPANVLVLHGRFNRSTWLTAIAGAPVLLLVFRPYTMGAQAGSGRRTSWAHR